MNAYIYVYCVLILYYTFKFKLLLIHTNDVNQANKFMFFINQHRRANRLRKYIISISYLPVTRTSCDVN